MHRKRNRSNLKYLGAQEIPKRALEDNFSACDTTRVRQRPGGPESAGGFETGKGASGRPGLSTTRRNKRGVSFMYSQLGVVNIANTELRAIHNES